jgi:PAS domain S-box-containing protein
VFDDITERILEKEKFLESEIKYRSLVEQSHDGIFIYRGDNFLFFNTKATEITGYSSTELYSMSIWDIVHPYDLEKMKTYSKKRIKGEDVPQTYMLFLV